MFEVGDIERRREHIKKKGEDNGRKRKIRRETTIMQIQQHAITQIQKGR